MAEMIYIEQLSDEDKSFIQKSLECDGEQLFDIDGDRLYIPFSFAHKNFELEEKKPKATENLQFKGELRPEQADMKEFVLKNKGTAIISAQPGFGKTITSIAIACNLNIKTAIVVNKLILLDQWTAALRRFVPTASVQIVTSKCAVLDDEASFYLVNAINIIKKSHDFWSCIKFVIVDELHQIITKKLSIALLRFQPCAILGLSATPHRYDDYDRAIEWFFGTRSIGKELNHRHSYRIVSTGWTPLNIQYTAKGLDWGKILEEQASSTERNAIVTEQCIREINDGRVVLVLVKRVVQAEMLMEKLTSRGVTKICTLVRSGRTFDVDCKILIGTTSKIGVGFDHAPIDCLIVAADIKNYFVQFLGRCMRSPDTIPTVVDFDDNFKVLKNHLKERVKEYRSHGGVAKQ